MSEHKTKVIYNPDSEDMIVTYDIHENRQPETFVLYAHDAQGFPDFIADHIAKHLANRLVRKRGNKINYELDYQNALKEIYEYDTNHERNS